MANPRLDYNIENGGILITNFVKNEEEILFKLKKKESKN